MDRKQCGVPSCRDCDASPAIDVLSQPVASCFSITWDVVVPIIVAAIPLAAFRLLGFVAHGHDKPNVVPRIAIVAIVVLQVTGIVAMAFVVLGRLDAAFRSLNASTNYRPAPWRRLTVFFSICCLLLTDLLANVSVAFSGAEFLLLGAVPAYAGYLVCKGVAFVGIQSEINHGDLDLQRSRAVESR